MKHRACAFAAPCLFLGLLSGHAAAGAQAPARTEVPGAVGVLADPCAAVDPIPPAVAAYKAAATKAAASKLPAPTPTAETIGLYTAWQQRQLAQDFSQLCFYAEQNASLPQPSAGRTIMFGDSITELWAIEDPGFFKDDILDRGISGQTTLQMIGRFRQDVIQLKPRVVHIMAGTNDIAGNTGPTSLSRIQANIATMAELAKANGIRVVLATVPPAAAFNWRPGIMPVDSIRELNVWLRDYAARNGFGFADYFPALEGPGRSLRKELTADGVHPNAAGYAAMRPIAAATLAKARQAGR